MEEKYPTKEQLKTIEEWDLTKNKVADLLHYIESIWWMSSWGFKLTGASILKLHLHTGGWSGNEDIIDSLQKNIFWNMYWVKTNRGGHYFFRIPLSDKNTGGERIKNRSYGDYIRLYLRNNITRQRRNQIKLEAERKFSNFNINDFKTLHETNQPSYEDIISEFNSIENVFRRAALKAKAKKWHPQRFKNEDFKRLLSKSRLKTTYPELVNLFKTGNWMDRYRAKVLAKERFKDEYNGKDFLPKRRAYTNDKLHRCKNCTTLVKLEKFFLLKPGDSIYWLEIEKKVVSTDLKTKTIECDDGDKHFYIHIEYERE